MKRRCLTLDCGNSAVKVVVHGADGAMLLSRVLSSVDELESLMQNAPELQDVDDVVLCATGADADAVRSLLPDRCNVLTVTADTPSPLTGIDYSPTLGGDRVAAAVGAMTQWPGRELLVVDYGTAVTYDRVSASGRFYGGNIAPGLKMRLDALTRGTALLPKVGVESCGDELFGHTTAQAIADGCIRGLAAETDYYLQKSSSKILLIITGRDCQSVAPLIDAKDKVIDPWLVNSGLYAIYCHQYEN